MAALQFKNHNGIAVGLNQADVDTDQIIPKQFLKGVTRLGLGKQLFYDWRYSSPGVPSAEFILNEQRYQGASVLVAGLNFGCGSSREHAVWALKEYGFKAIIAPSFADIFSSNCYQNGVPPIRLTEEQVQTLMERIATTPGYQLTVDLETLTVSDDSGLSFEFVMDEFKRNCLMFGLDEIELTLKHKEAIERYESKRLAYLK